MDLDKIEEDLSKDERRYLEEEDLFYTFSDEMDAHNRVNFIKKRIAKT